MFPAKQKLHRLVRCATLLLIILSPPAQGAWKAGDQFPELESFHLEGNIPRDLKGKVVLVDFWASWCGPCKVSFPAMEKLQAGYRANGLRIVAISVDEKRENMERFVKAAGTSFPTARDADQKLVAAADVATMPTSFIVDRKGKIRFVHVGFTGDQTVKQYHQEIEELLKSPPHESDIYISTPLVGTSSLLPEHHGLLHGKTLAAGTARRPDHAT